MPLQQGCSSRGKAGEARPKGTACGGRAAHAALASLVATPIADCIVARVRLRRDGAVGPMDSMQVIKSHARHFAARRQQVTPAAAFVSRLEVDPNSATVVAA
jgi:hypothetical protein